MATIINAPRDPNTLSNYNNWLSTHVTANLEILFDQKKLAGNVVHRLKSTTESQSRDILLDTSQLDIDGVRVDGKPSKWELLAPLEPYGTALKIQLDHGVKLHEVVEVDVRLCHEQPRHWSTVSNSSQISVKTTDKCTALQWLTPAQTSNKKHPYMCM